MSLTVMGACPGNALLSQADLDQAVARLTEAARPLIAPMLAAIHDTAEVGAAARLGGPAGWSEV